MDSEPAKKVNSKLVSAVVLGNTIAWADFALYAYFSPILAKVFFPFTSYSTSLTLYFLIFAAGFVFRPLGAMISGAYADKHGRRKTLLATVIISSVCTAMIGVLPGYDKLGYFSIVLLLAVRILQTMAISAEPTNSTALLIELGHNQRRGFISSSVMCGVFLGFSIGILSFYLITVKLDDAQIALWGWRIPFISFLFIGLLVAVLLNTVDESPVFLAHKARGEINKSPIQTSFNTQIHSLVISFGYGIMMAMGNYFLLGFMPSFLTHDIGLTLEEANLAILVCLLVSTALIPVCGLISDHVGRRPVMATGAVLFILTSYPTFSFIAQGELSYAIIGLVIYAIALAPTAAVLTTAITEMFPFALRCTGGAIGYNVALTVAGGLTPLICQHIYRLTGDIYSLVYYITLMALIHLLFVLFSKETKNNAID
ncbi:Proline/betaine transporter [BD1-7 clade bacterium]|uniref:Proline/betaine transporter n=1 Tax=BD1-7 clade bacterium TaxID=2029982 RepID=A0A5S9PZ28_9GAMM|nr:Proline/betaine transporter [BD1-7 clade bacterium]CAA0109736.1 Proline/betaine transporter [BD1-7 clade bacterium]